MKKRQSPKRRPAGELAHRHHTGKLLPRKHTSYASLLFILLLVGVLLVGLNKEAQAADIYVNGRVAGTPPTTPAVITSPLDGKHFSSTPITVDGTCQSATIVKLYRNASFSGAVFCAADNTFSLNSDLFPGSNALTARVFNLGDTEGPASQPVEVYYDAPAAVSPASAVTTVGSSSTSPAAPASPLSLQTNVFYRGYNVGDTVHWQLGVGGGQAPYAIAVDWGDGSTSVLSQSQAGLFQISHIYKKAGGYHGNYPIRVRASDAAGQGAFMQLVVIVNNRVTVNSVGILGATPTLPSSIAQYWKPVWPVYGVTTLMVASFWLGQHRAFGFAIQRTVANRSLRSRRR